MKKILFLLLFSVSFYGQTLQNPTFGIVTEKNNASNSTPAYLVTQETDGVHKKTPASLFAKTQAVQDSLDKKLNISDLPTNLTLYPTTTASDVSGYVVMVTDIHDVRYNTVSADVSTPTITTTSQLVSQRISDAGVLIGQPGVFNITTFGNIRHLSGSGTATFYFEVYHRDAAGVETLICTSSTSNPVTDGGYTEFSASGVWDDGDFAATDRIVIKSYANRIVGGSDPVYQFQFGGATPVRTLLPVPFSVVDAGYEMKTNKINAYAVDGSGTKYYTADYINSKLPTSYTKIVYVNATSPNTATIFDLNNPPVTNDNALKLDTANLYIGTDASTWVYNGSTYVTKTVPDISNFVFSGTTTDAGNDKVSTIYRAGSIQTGGILQSNEGNFVVKNGSNTANSGGRFAFYNSGFTVSSMLQLNASNGLDLWNYASGVWTKRFTFSSGGNLSLLTAPVTSAGSYHVLTRNDSTGEVEQITASSGVSGAKVYNVKDYGALGDGSTDDTSAIQTTINTAFAAGGGVVYFPNGIYIIGGNLITSLDSVNPNCQLYIPLVLESNIGTAPVIKFLGETPPNFNVSGLIAWAENNKGVVLKSIITGSGTNPSVIGSSYSTTTFGNFNYTQLEIENISIRVKSKSGATHIAPTVGGINAGNIELFSATNLRIDSESENFNGAQPTNVVTGIIMPYINNNAWSYLNRVSIENMNIGISVSEHTNGQNVAIWSCVKGLNIESSNHLSSFDHILIAWCNYNIYVPNSVSPIPVLKINNFVIEDYNNSYGIKWYVNTNDIYDSSDLLRGEAKFLKVISNVGKVNSLSCVGSRNFNKYNLYRQGERYEVIGSTAEASTTGPGLSGFSNNAILEVNSGNTSSVDDGFANLYLTHTQTGANRLVGRLSFINLGSTISDKRLSQIYTTTAANKETGKIYITVNNGTSMQSVIAIEGERVILDKPLKLKGYTVATLPTGVQGDTAFVTDALTPSYLVTIVGGGSIVTPVFYNGTTWVAH